MVNVPIRDIAQTGIPSATSNIVFDDGSMKRATVADLADGVRPVASQSEAQTGSDNSKTMSPLRVKQSIASEVGVTVASKSQGDAANTALQPAAIGSTVQAYDADLAVIASLSPANNDFLQRKSGAWTNRTPTQAKADLSLSTVATSGSYNDLTDKPAIPAAGVPTGGTTNQVLLKNSGTNYDVKWGNAGAGDMIEATYDPNSVKANAFDSANQSFTPTVTSPAVRTSYSKMSDRHDLRDYNGLDLTGANDMASLVQKAFDDSVSNRSALQIPSGIIVLDTTVNVPNGCVMEGRAMPYKFGGVPSSSDPYSWFHIAHTGVGFNLSGDSRRVMKKFGTFRDQPTPGAGTFTPTDHDFDILATNSFGGLIIDEWNMHNASRGLKVTADSSGTSASGQVSISNVYGQPMIFGFWLEFLYDVLRLRNMHLWPFWSLNEKVLAYQRASSIAIQSGRNDNPQMDDLFSWGYRYGLYIANTPTSGSVVGGTTANFQIGKMQSDACETALVVAPDADGCTGHIADMIAVGDGNVTTEFPRGFNLRGTNARLSIGRFKCAGAWNEAAALQGTGNIMNIGRSDTSLVNISNNGKYHYFVGDGETLSISDDRPLFDASGAGKILSVGVASANVWRSFTPTVTVTGGAGTATCAFKTEGNETTFTATISVGTGGTLVSFTLPIAVVGTFCVSGRETARSGLTWTATLNGSSAVTNNSQNNTNSVTTGDVLTFSGSYRSS